MGGPSKMNQELVDRSLAYTEALRSHPIAIGMEFDHETLEAISSKVSQNKDIRALFPTANGLPIDYICEIRCDKCSTIEKRPLKKTQLISYMENLRKKILNISSGECLTVATCNKCKDAEKLSEQQKRREIDRKYYLIHQNQIQLNTENLIKYYLWPDAKPGEGADWQKLNSQMRTMVCSCDEEKISEAINEMEYGEFLRTPYWKIISFEVKRKNKFKCVMCDSNEHLQVHHKNYSLHGYEHTHSGMQSLTCVCDECHSKHHGHYE